MFKRQSECTGWRGWRGPDLKTAPLWGPYSRSLGASPPQGLRHRVSEPGTRPAGPARTGSQSCLTESCPPQGLNPQLRRRGWTQRQGQGHFSPPGVREGGRKATALLAKPSGTAIRSPGLTTYRLRSPAAAAAAPQPRRAAAAILVRVRRCGTGRSTPNSLRNGAQAPRRRRPAGIWQGTVDSAPYRPRAALLRMSGAGLRRLFEIITYLLQEAGQRGKKKSLRRLRRRPQVSKRDSARMRGTVHCFFHVIGAAFAQPDPAEHSIPAHCLW